MGVPGSIAALFPEVIVEGKNIRAQFDPGPEHEGQQGWVQGGFSATVLDYICAMAATRALGQQAITGQLSLRYPRPVLLNGGPYQVVASAESPRSKTVRASGAILNHDDQQLVTASGLFVVCPKLTK